MNHKILFLGEDSFSAVVLQSLLNKELNVSAVISPYYDNNKHKRIEFITNKNKIPYYRVNEINSIETIQLIESHKPELIVTSHFEKILCKKIIKLPKYGCLNLHPSLLPNYRGMSPQHWPIINGEGKTGVTVHFINEEVDKGDIIEQEEVIIDTSWYVSDLQLRFVEIYKRIMVNAIIKVFNGTHSPQKQSHINTKYYGKLKESECQLSSKMSKKQAYNLIRAVSKPYFGAHIDGYRIWKAKLFENKELENKLIKLCKNSILLINDKIYLKVDDGLLEILKYEKI